MTDDFAAAMAHHRDALRRRGAHSRNKGARVERHVAEVLFGLTGIEFSHNLEQTRDSSQADLVPSDPAFPFILEVKTRASGHGCQPAWQAQAVKAADKAGKIPVVLVKYDRRDVRCHIPVSAIAEAAGGAWIDCDTWADVSLEGLAYVARELMARAALMEAAE